MTEDDEAQDPSENDGAGQDGSEEQQKTRIEARAYNQEVVIESHDASAQELSDIAREQLEFQFKESRRGELIQLEEEERHPLFSDLG